MILTCVCLNAKCEHRYCKASVNRKLVIVFLHEQSFNRVVRGHLKNKLFRQFHRFLKINLNYKSNCTGMIYMNIIYTVYKT